MTPIAKMVSHLEYIWLDSKQRLRSNVYVTDFVTKTFLMAPKAFDGSSTDQADTDLLLLPKHYYKHPFLDASYIVLCEVANMDLTPVDDNRRSAAVQKMEEFGDAVPLFGLEVEFFIEEEGKPSTFCPAGEHYCGSNISHRQFVIDAVDAAVTAGVTIHGYNAEVAPGQWEIRTGPKEGIAAADDYWVLRFILQRLAERRRLRLNFQCKPYNDQNGSGCHVNFSTERTRQDGGVRHMQDLVIPRLQAHHKQLQQLCGADNHKRLTGSCETPHPDTFTCGVGNRTCTVRIPALVHQAGKGYLEYREPGATMDPYELLPALLEAAVSPLQ